MDKETLVNMVLEAKSVEKMSPKYQLQLNKVAEMEEKFVKDFSKEKWK